MLPEEQAEQQPLLLRARLGALRLVVGQVLTKVQAFHFKGGQARQDRHRRPPAGHEGRRPRSPRCAACPKARTRSRRRAFPTGRESTQFRRFADEVRERTGGIPIGFKLSAQHIEEDIDAALAIGCRLHHPRRPRRRDRRGAADLPRQHLGADDPGARPGAAPSRPARPPRRHARSSPAGCARRPISPRRSRSAPTRSRSPTRRSRRSAASACAPATPTTARSASRRRSRIWRPGSTSRNPPSGWRGFCETSVELMKILARACGHTHLNQLTRDNLTTWKEEMARLAGVPFGGVGSV